MHVIINAGSGPVPDTDRTTAAAAAENMTQFVADLAGLGTTVAVCTATPDGDSGDGRYAFRLDLADGRAVDVEMPGIPSTRSGTWGPPDRTSGTSRACTSTDLPGSGGTRSALAAPPRTDRPAGRPPGPPHERLPARRAQLPFLQGDFVSTHYVNRDMSVSNLGSIAEAGDVAALMEAALRGDGYQVMATAEPGAFPHEAGTR